MRARLDPAGFRGYGCAICGVVIPESDTTQIPISITAGGRSFRYWAHRECFRGCLTVRLQPTVDKIPPVDPDEITPSRAHPQ